MAFDLPINKTQIVEVFSVADGFTGGLMGIVIWIIVGFGSLMLTSNFGMKQSMISSSFILMVISLFLKYGMNILSDFFVWLSAILFLASLILGSIKGTNGA